MSARTPRLSVTKATVEAALRDARSGETYDRHDPGCKGLMLRVRSGAVVWSVARFGGKKPATCGSEMAEMLLSLRSMEMAERS